MANLETEECVDLVDEAEVVEKEQEQLEQEVEEDVKEEVEEFSQ